MQTAVYMYGLLRTICNEHFNTKELRKNGKRKTQKIKEKQHIEIQKHVLKFNYMHRTQ